MLKRVGLVGSGTIGRHIVRALLESEFAQIAFICDLDVRGAAEIAPGVDVFDDLAGISTRRADLVVEAANAEVMQRIALDVLAKGNFLPFSVTALANNDFYCSVLEQCKRCGTVLFVPHGALLGLDGVFDGRTIIESVTIRTIKKPANLGLAETEVGTIYDGPTREACRRFPRNVNVHAALALVGLGFDHQRSIIVSDPETPSMRHEIEISGPGIEWKLMIASVPVGTVTGSYTPSSAASTVMRTLKVGSGITLA
ncbi:MAG: DUF108 domain-containing protein [Rhodospirillales bacterium]|jgi:aspartate dehydrogenase|nr:DUF108 domain-containing protein [Rhodospirillales bacterium]